MGALVAAGFRLGAAPRPWLTKLWLGEVDLDVDRSSTSPVELDEDMLARGQSADVWERLGPGARPRGPRRHQGPRPR